MTWCFTKLKLTFKQSFTGDSKSPQVSRTLFSILAVLNNGVVWMVFTRPPTSNSSRPFNNPLVTVPKASMPIVYMSPPYSIVFSIPEQGPTLWEFFTSVLADGLSLKFEWQQVSTSLQDYSQYSGRSQKCNSLDGLHSFCYFQVLQFL